VLTDEEEAALLSVACDKNTNPQDRDNARHLLVLHNLRFIIQIASRYRNHDQLEVEDLVHEGIAGMLVAIDEFDTSRGNKLPTYAAWWIRQSIFLAIKQHPAGIHIASTIPVSKILRAHIRLSYKLGRTPSIDEVAQSTGYDSGTVRDALILAADVSHLNDRIHPNDSRTFADVLESDSKPDEEAVSSVFWEQLNALIGGIITEREHKMLISRVISGESLEGIGMTHGISKERVRQILERIMNNLMDNEDVQQCYHDYSS